MEPGWPGVDAATTRATPARVTARAPAAPSREAAEARNARLMAGAGDGDADVEADTAPAIPAAGGDAERKRSAIESALRGPAPARGQGLIPPPSPMSAAG